MKTIKYKFKSVFFEIESDIDLESDIISVVLPAAVDYSNAENRAQIKFKIIKTTKSEDEFIIYKDQQEAFCCGSKRSAISSLEWLVTTSILNIILSPFLLLHAGGIVNNNKKAMLIVAAAEAGKSSTVTGLLLKGFKCLSDDVVLIDTDSEDVHFVPRSFKISKDLHRHLPELNNKLDVTNTTTVEEQYIRFNPERICRDPFSNASEVGWIIFLTNNGSAGCKLRPVGQIEALRLFFQETLNIEDHGYKCIDRIASIIEGSVCYEMNRGNLDETISLLSDLMTSK